MGLFRKRDEGETELARTLARRGVSVTGTVAAMHETGETRGNTASQYEFTVAFELPPGTAQRVTTRQFMNDINCTGLAPGEPVMLLVDSQSPTSLLVLQSPKYVFVRNPMMAFDGKPVIAVTAAEAAERGLDPT